MGVPTDERGRKLRGREPEPLFLVEWKDWPSPTTWTKKPYESFGDFSSSQMASRRSARPRASPGGPQRLLQASWSKNLLMGSISPNARVCEHVRAMRRTS